MRLTHRVSTLAVVLSTAAVAAAPAQAKFDNSTYPPLGSLHPTVQHHSSGGTDDALIAIGALAAAATLGGGVAVSRRSAGRSARVRVVSGS